MTTFDNKMVGIQFAKNFDNTFSVFKNDRIAIYGIGNYAQHIFNYCKNYTFSCVCAKDHLGEKFCGKVVVPLEKALENSDLMIIAATPHSTRIIYNRIKSFIPKGYTVYNMAGHNMSINVDYQKNSYWEKDYDDLKDAIDSHEIISFDIFDTLVMRKVLYPHDIFSLIEEGNNEAGDFRPFAKWRVEAEAKQLSQGYFPNWQEIYQYMKKEHYVSDTDIQIWQNREWTLEMQAIIPRKDIVRAFDYAKSQGKKVVLCSDMYFSQQDMKKMLSSKGIEGYDKLIISCDYQASKSDGKLFFSVLQFASGKSVLHIGDNEYSDEFVPKELEIDTFPIKNSLDILEESSCSSVLKHTHNLLDRVLLGNAISCIFNSPFCLSSSKGKVVLDDLSSYLCLCILPVTMRYMQYIVQLATIDHNSILLFVSRDGYFLHKIYQKIAQEYHLPDSAYFYTSRQAAYASMISNEKEFEFMVKYILTMVNDNLNLKYQLDHSFQSSFPEELNISVADAKKIYGLEKLMNIIISNSQSVLQTEKRNRNNYLKYIDKLHLEKYHRILCVDLDTKGTIAYALHSLIDKPVELVTLIAGECVSVFVPEEKNRHLLYGTYNPFSLIGSYCSILEIIYASRDGQVSGFDENGNPLFLDCSKYNTILLDQAQDILMNQIMKCLDNKWCKHTLSKDFCSEMLGFMSEDYTIISHEASEGFVFSDSLNPNHKHINNFLRYLRNEKD